MTGRVVHFEVPCDDADRVRALYRTVFGWEIQPVPEFDDNFVHTGPTEDTGKPPESGDIGGGMFERETDVALPAITTPSVNPSRSATWGSRRTSPTAKATSWGCGNR